MQSCNALLNVLTMIVRLGTSLCYIVDMVPRADGVAWTWCERCCGLWLLWGHFELNGIWETFSLLMTGKKIGNISFVQLLFEMKQIMSFRILL